MIIKQKRVNNVETLIAGLPQGIKKVILSYKLQDKSQELKKAGFAAEDLVNGNYILPSVVGPVSRFNAHGKLITRKDLPKERRFVMERLWAWKQWAGRGETIDMEKIVYIYRDCYPRELIKPFCKEFIYSDGSIISAPQTIADSEELKHLTNLFLEFFGECEILNEDLSSAVKAKRVNWEILPAGEDPWENTEKYLRNCGIVNSSMGLPIIARQELLHSFKPLEVVYGTAGFKGYLAYIFKDLVLLESVKYGNAIYVFDKNWENFSKLSKAEIISDHLHKERIIHNEAWIEKVRKILNK